MHTDTKIVEFDKYCFKCKNLSTDPTQVPCNECLTTPANIDSHKPINFKEKVK